MQYLYPVQEPVLAAAMGLVPAELEIEGLYEYQDRRSKKGGSDKVVSPHVQSVCKRYTPIPKKADNSTSVGALRIEPRNRRSVTGKSST
jgi:hypothetical protein